MRRRSFLRRWVAVTVPVAFGGCLFSGDGNDDGGDDGTDDDPQNDPQIAEFRGVLVDEAPASASVISHSDDRIADVDLLQQLLKRAADSSAESERWTSDGEEYDVVTVSESYDDAEKRRAADALDELPTYTDEEHRDPRGVYISHPEQLVAVSYWILWGDRSANFDRSTSPDVRRHL